jgi:hypothetical protein
MIKSEQYIIIPTGISSFVLEVKGDTIELVGNPEDRTQEQVFNEIRKTLFSMVTQETKLLENAIRMYKRFHATKEFMSEEELEYTSEGWNKFDPVKFESQCKKAREIYERSLFEFTDLMLEYNIPLHSIGPEQSDIQGFSMSDVKNLLGNFDGSKKAE